MNQILYRIGEETTKIEEERLIEKQEVPNRKKNAGKKGIALMGTLIGITSITLLSFGISSWNIAHLEEKASKDLNLKASAEEELNIVLNKEMISKVQNSIVQENQVIQNSQEVTKEEKTKKPSTQKVTASNGKSYTSIATLSIPSLKIEYPVLSKTSPELLKIALNKYWGANPNEVGNFCIIGHNYNDSRFFGKLHKIKKGAEIKLTDNSGRTLIYKVYQTATVDPYDTTCTSQLTNGNTEITLITCNYDGSKRFVVKARNEVKAIN